jgi:hypothetical protein
MAGRDAKLAAPHPPVIFPDVLLDVGNDCATVLPVKRPQPLLYLLCLAFLGPAFSFGAGPRGGYIHFSTADCARVLSGFVTARQIIPGENETLLGDLLDSTFLAELDDWAPTAGLIFDRNDGQLRFSNYPDKIDALRRDPMGTLYVALMIKWGWYLSQEFGPDVGRIFLQFVAKNNSVWGSNDAVLSQGIIPFSDFVIGIPFFDAQGFLTTEEFSDDALMSILFGRGSNSLASPTPAMIQSAIRHTASLALSRLNEQLGYRDPLPYFEHFYEELSVLRRVEGTADSLLYEAYTGSTQTQLSQHLKVTRLHPAGAEDLSHGFLVVPVDDKYLQGRNRKILEVSRAGVYFGERLIALAVGLPPALASNLRADLELIEYHTETYAP